jgi:hypothetical protein
MAASTCDLWPCPVCGKRRTKIFAPESRRAQESPMDMNGKVVDWMEHVSDKQYRK